MEQTEQQDNTTLAGSLADLIRYYHQLQEEIKRLEISKEIARNTLLERFKAGKLREYVVDNLQAAVTTSIRRSISVKEAEAMLDEPTFRKLCKESKPLIILTVRPIKGKEEEAYE